MSYHTTQVEAVQNAAQLIRAGAQGVKLEGGRKRLPMIEAIIDAEIPVMGHLGLTPQSVHAMGGFKVQGREHSAALELVADAKALAAAGCFAIVLEGVPDEVARMVTDAVDVPTVGIGAGPGCDGQVLVYHDVLGIEDRILPKFVRRYADLKAAGVEALSAYAADVRSGAFPAAEESYHLSADVAETLGLYGLAPDRRLSLRRPSPASGSMCGVTLDERRLKMLLVVALVLVGAGVWAFVLRGRRRSRPTRPSASRSTVGASSDRRCRATPTGAARGLRRARRVSVDPGDGSLAGVVPARGPRPRSSAAAGSWRSPTSRATRAWRSCTRRTSRTPSTCATRRRRCRSRGSRPTDRWSPSPTWSPARTATAAPRYVPAGPVPLRHRGAPGRPRRRSASPSRSRVVVGGRCGAVTPSS